MKCDRATHGPAVLGVYLGHDPGACLLRNGHVVAMIEEERLNRFKHGRPDVLAGLWSDFRGMFGYFPWASVTYCLKAAGLELAELDLVAVGDDLWAAAAADKIQSVIPLVDSKRVRYYREPHGAAHHLHHAMAAFFASGFADAAVLVVDADGNSNAEGYESESGYIFHDREGRYDLCFKNRYASTSVPRAGLGWMYEQITYVLGFGNARLFLADAGKTMGLSAYGRYSSDFEQPWVGVEGTTLDFGGFCEWMRPRGYNNAILHRTRGLAHVGGSDKPTQYACDLAYKVQTELEQGLLALVRELWKRTGCKNLCLSGGVALNSVANGRILNEGPFENVYIVPAANDGGQSLGLAYRGQIELAKAGSGKCEITRLASAFTGVAYTQSAVTEVLKDSGCQWCRFSSQEEYLTHAASSIAKGEIIGWFSGGSEVGPRALGHRSILASAVSPEIKDILNARVKFREGFRPFAPAVLAEYASEVFEITEESPYMLLVVPVREKWRQRVPGITHVDGTARLQTVAKEHDPVFYDLIRRYHDMSGIPLVINTSFNLRGMPIVESPLDAMECFLLTELDALYIEGNRVEKPIDDVLAVEWLPQCRFETTASGAHQARVTVRMQGKTFSSVVSDTSAALIQELGDNMRMSDVSERLGVSELVTHEAATYVRGAARAGICALRYNNLRVGLANEGLHWWQVNDESVD
jgi:carbamoyltransferase